MDIAHDRAGYYLCWGCLNWIPSVYTSQPLFLSSHPYQLHPALAATIFLAGAACIYINWDSDRQRQVRQHSSLARRDNCQSPLQDNLARRDILGSESAVILK